MNMEVTKRIDFNCCYIQNHQIEAHNCKLEVTVVGPQRFNDLGRVITYEDLTKYMKEVVPDKAFLFFMSDESGVIVANAFKKAGCRIVGCDFEISAENVCSYCASELQDQFDTFEPGIKIIDMKFREDNNSFVSWKPGN